MAPTRSPFDRLVRAARYRAEQAFNRFVLPAERDRHDPEASESRARAIARERVETPHAYDGLVVGAQIVALDPFEGAPAGPRPPTKEFADIPVSMWANWNVQNARSALMEHAIGIFGRTSLLVESMLGDDRVQTAFNGYVKNITKCEPNLVPGKDPDAGACATEIEDLWEDMLTAEDVEQLFQWSRFIGAALAEIVWEPWENQNRWIPRLKVWHPLYVYYRIDIRRYVAITQEGMLEIDPDDPKWFLYTPYGAYRGWLRGACRAITTPWLVRQFALRDWARFSEVHGLPIRLAKVPAQAPSEDKARFFASVRNLGAESVMLLPVQAGKDAAIWDAKLLEATDRSWEAFPGIRDACDQSITLGIRGTNLTTSVGQGNSGNRAAAETHREEDQDYSVADRKKFCRKLRTHLFRFYAIYNFGTIDAAPSKVRLVDPDGKDLEGEFKAMSASVQVIKDLRDIGAESDERELLDRGGVPRKPDAELENVDDDDEKIALLPADVAAVVTVDEGRGSLGLEPFGDERGSPTIEESRQAAKAKGKSPPGENSGTGFGGGAESEADSTEPSGD